MRTDVASGKKKTKLSFLMRISPGSFLSFRSGMRETRRNTPPIAMSMSPVRSMNFPSSFVMSSATLKLWVRRESNPRPWD